MYCLRSGQLDGIDDGVNVQVALAGGRRADLHTEKFECANMLVNYSALSCYCTLRPRQDVSSIRHRILYLAIDAPAQNGFFLGLEWNQLRSMLALERKCAAASMQTLTPYPD